CFGAIRQIRVPAVCDLYVTRRVVLRRDRKLRNTDTTDHTDPTRISASVRHAPSQCTDARVFGCSVTHGESVRAAMSPEEATEQIRVVSV
ncbi:hypothetical protein, partial [Gemmatimonas sp.]|uniref:hypothetical protein n=1 Tax=Gemmatimonas sp. TaxID=1962908 RepID=UPI0037C13744